MLVRKCTAGWVEQVFDTEKQIFVSQKFYTSDEVEYLTGEGTPIRFDLTAWRSAVDPAEYLPYDMVQPRAINDLTPITWREVLTSLHQLTDDQLDMTASIWDSELQEVLPIFDARVACAISDDLADIVGGNQPLLVI